MEPLNDRELDELLGRWRAPEAPESLNRRVLARRDAWWRWLLTGSVRVPVPLTIAVAGVLAALVLMAVMRSPSKEPVRSPEQVALHPVKRIELRIIRSNYENIR
jgi:hypothetical protein